MNKRMKRKMKSAKHPIDLIPAFILGCLNAVETQSLSHHIHSCKACRKEVAAYQSIVFQLGHSVPTVEPPAHIKSAVLYETKASQHENRTTYHTKRRRFDFGFFTPAWSAAAAILIIVLGAGNLLLWDRVRHLRHEIQSGDAHLIELEGEEGAPSAEGYLYISDDGREGTLIAEELPVLTKDQVYQVWLIQDGSRTSGGVFSVSDDGYGSLRIISSSPLNTFSSIGVSIEPAGGSISPTGEKVLGGELKYMQH